MAFVFTQLPFLWAQDQPFYVRCECMCICMCVCMHVCIYAWVKTEVPCVTWDSFGYNWQKILVNLLKYKEVTVDSWKL